MEERKWENLNQDCLAKIFEKVGLKALLMDVPFVCKAWFKATLIPDCWKFLDFELLREELFDHDSLEEMIEFAIRRSCGNALQLVLPETGLLWKTETLFEVPQHLVEARRWWKDLELISVRDVCSNLKELVTQISIHCENLVTLIICGYISHEEASTLVTLLTKIKCLELRSSVLSKECLKLILVGCKELESLDVSYCIGFEENDYEILKMASHIKCFRSIGSSSTLNDCRTRFDYDSDYEDGNSSNSDYDYFYSAVFSFSD